MPDNPNFSDIQSYWARDCIQELASRKIVSGYPDGQFRPEASVTRAEFAAMVQKAFPQATVIRPATSFTDVPTIHWAAGVIQSIYRAGFMSGYPDRTFKPSQPIPRVQAFVALVAGLQYRSTKPIPATLQQYYEDAGQIPDYAKPAIAAATEKRLVVNYPQVRRLNPNQNMTRGELTALICRTLKLPVVPLQSVVGMEFVVIPPQFAAAGTFKGGVAPVKVGNQWGYINAQGKWVIQPQFSEASDLAEGLGLGWRQFS